MSVCACLDIQTGCDDELYGAFFFFFNRSERNQTTKTTKFRETRRDILIPFQ